MSQEQSQTQDGPVPGADSRAPGLFDAYRPRGTAFDEFAGAGREGSSLWQPFVEVVNRNGPGGIASIWQRGTDLLRENGIAHNLLPDDPDAERRCALDPIPVILPESEWESLSNAVIQRARLWNRILHDCYGPQDLLRCGLIPPSLLFAQPNFNRSLRHVPNPGEALLSMYAVDVARGPDGSWTVVADRTEAPNGQGFALENRIVVTSVFPEISKRVNLLRLASYFQAFRAMLFAKAPAAIESPRVVLLSPGPGGTSYFEDAYLSRYLGITLAVGEELTVRGDRLYLKTVSGLQRVDVLIRRVAELEADPLETPTKSHRGVPGLMQVIRSGGLTVINPPGTGIAEAPAFLPFLPGLARQLLSEDLLLPSIETHWSGNTAGLAGTLDPGSSIVKSAFTRNVFPPSITRTLDDAALATLRGEIAAHPGRHVVQREMPFSHAPAWTGDTLEPRPIAIRLFVFAEGDTYRVMPGGFVRCASAPEALPGLSLHDDTNTKDLWILSGRDRPAVTATNIPPHIALRRGSGNLSSRAADNMLWIGRYSERAEYAARILLEIVHCVTDDQDSLDDASLRPLLNTLAHLDYLDAGTLDLEALAGSRGGLFKTLQPLFFGRAPARPKHLDSIPLNLVRLRSLAAHSRDRLSNESWRIIQGLEGIVREPLPATLTGFLPQLQRAILYQSAFNGTCRENLTRGEGWRFLNIGHRLERCTWLLALVEETLNLYPTLPSTVLDSVLSIADCTLTYRFRYQGAPTVLPALDLLLYDPANPRGLAYQLADLDSDFASLPPPPPEQIMRPAHRIIQRALHHLQTEFLPADDPKGEARAVEDLRLFVARLREDIPAVAEQLGWEFFAHASFTAS